MTDPDGTGFWVEVDEDKVMATYQGANWWQLHRQRFVASGKLTVVKPGFFGDLIRITAADAEEAEFMRGHMVDVGGMPRTAVRVVGVPRRRPKQAQ